MFQFSLIYQKLCEFAEGKTHPFLIIESWGGGLGPRGIRGRVQGVGLMSCVNTRPLVCGTPHGTASGDQEKPFSRLALAG